MGRQDGCQAPAPCSVQACVRAAMWARGAHALGQPQHAGPAAVLACAHAQAMYGCIGTTDKYYVGAGRAGAACCPPSALFTTSPHAAALGASSHPTWQQRADAQPPGSAPAMPCPVLVAAPAGRVWGGDRGAVQHALPEGAEGLVRSDDGWQQPERIHQPSAGVLQASAGAAPTPLGPPRWHWPRGPARVPCLLPRAAARPPTWARGPHPHCHLPCPTRPPTHHLPTCPPAQEFFYAENIVQLFEKYKVPKPVFDHLTVSAGAPATRLLQPPSSREEGGGAWGLSQGWPFVSAKQPSALGRAR